MWGPFVSLTHANNFVDVEARPYLKDAMDLDMPRRDSAAPISNDLSGLVTYQARLPGSRLLQVGTVMQVRVTPSRESAS